MTDSTDSSSSLFDKLPDLKAIGALAKARRKHEGISIKRLAAIVGCSHVAVIELEKGSGKINISTAWRILDALGLIGENEKAKRPSLTKLAGMTAGEAFKHLK